MFDEVGVVDAALQVALRGLSARQRVIADNVANVDTPGFKASEVRFEAELRRALASRVQPAAVKLVEISPTVVPLTGTTVRADGNNVDIERELLLLTETSLRYGAVARTLGERLGLLQTILTDGRR